MMEYTLAEDRMAEAEVSLRLAFHLLSMPDASGEVEVAIDGAQIRVHGDEIFPIQDFLCAMGWQQTEQRGKNDWQGRYKRLGHHLRIHSRSGIGDVVAQVGGERIRAECKGGPLIKKPGSKEYPKLRGALGQIITVEHFEENDVLAVAVPHTPRFRRLADKWRQAPLIEKADIRIVLLGRDGTVEGLDLGE
jgi:hypothetical protein